MVVDLLLAWFPCSMLLGKLLSTVQAIQQTSSTNRPAVLPRLRFLIMSLFYFLVFSHGDAFNFWIKEYHRFDDAIGCIPLQIDICDLMHFRFSSESCPVSRRHRQLLLGRPQQLLSVWLPPYVPLLPWQTNTLWRLHPRHEEFRTAGVKISNGPWLSIHRSGHVSRRQASLLCSFSWRSHRDESIGMGGDLGVVGDMSPTSKSGGHGFLRHCLI